MITRSLAKRQEAAILISIYWKCFVSRSVKFHKISKLHYNFDLFRIVITFNNKLIGLSSQFTDSIKTDLK
jgi:hypothetical protein